MTESEVPDEMLIGMLRERGYRVEREEEPSLAEKVDAVGAKLDQMREAPRSPEEEDYRLAEQLRAHMNASLGHWYRPGGNDGP